MKRRKLYLTILIFTILATLFSVTALADTESSETVSEPSWSDKVLEAIADKSVDVDINYTPDSVLFEGISYEPYVDVLTEESGIMFAKDLPIGYCIYDDTSTPHIDGVRVNGECITAMKLPIDFLSEATQFKFTVDVKIVYADGVLGDIARMSDGTYDWTNLLANPVIVLQAVYYVLAVLSVLLAIVAAFRNKDKSVKTSDEIASKVTEAADASLDKIRAQVVETVMAEATPVLQNILDDIQNVVKAVTLSTSNSKEAPLALLDTLQKSASVDVSKIINEVRINVEHSITDKAAIREANIATLHDIAHPKTSNTEVVKDVKTESDSKSVF